MLITHSDFNSFLESRIRFIGYLTNSKSYKSIFSYGSSFPTFVCDVLKLKIFSINIIILSLCGQTSGLLIISISLIE